MVLIHCLRLLLDNRKGVYTFTFVDRSRTEHCTGKIGMVWAIGKVLRFQAESCPEFILTVTEFIFSLHKIAGIELQTRFTGVNTHHDSGLISHGNRCRHHLAFVQYKVVVISFSVDQLRIVLINILTNGFGYPKIKRRVFYRLDHSRWDKRRIHRSETIGIDHQ